MLLLTQWPPLQGLHNNARACRSMEQQARVGFYAITGSFVLVAVQFVHAVYLLLFAPFAGAAMLLSQFILPLRLSADEGSRNHPLFAKAPLFWGP